MKFIHIADMHFDAPFSSNIYSKNFEDVRRLEQREAFKKIIEYAKENDINYMFISGDLYEHNYIKKSTIEYINNLFKTIPSTKIFISPGNHDPNVKNSYYDTFEFSSNVKIFKNSNIEKISDEDVDIYGFGFNDFYMDKNPIEEFVLEDSSKPQILIMHADLNGVKDEDGYSYAPINELKLKSKKFDYIALRSYT